MPKATKTKLKRNAISLGQKVEILDRLRKGEGSTLVAKAFGFNEATIRTIKKNEEKIRKSVAAASSISAKKTSHARDVIMEMMEKALMIWIEDNTQKRMPLDGNVIRYKAVKIFNHLKETRPEPALPSQPSTSQQSFEQQTPIREFSGSKGWFENFKKRFSLHNVKLQGETASADEAAAKVFPKELAKIIEEHGYTADQVFNADETGLCWKKMPKRTYIAKSEKTARGFKAAKDRITLLFCSNASGDFMTKPLFIHRSLNPRAMKSLDKTKLPVHWRSNKKAWITASLFKDWFLNCFVSEVEKYMLRKNLNFKVLLLLDNATGHPQELSHPNIKVVFFPPNTTSLTQPLDQGVISTFKAYYIRRTFKKILDEMVSDSSLTVSQVWKNFTILDCVKIVALAVEELRPSTLNGSWKPIWPEVVLLNNRIQPVVDEYRAIVDLAHTLGGEGFEDLAIQDVEELLAEPNLGEEELVAMVNETYTDLPSSDTDTETDAAEQNFTLKSLREGFEMAKKLENHFLANDPSMDRSLKIQREIEKCLAPYREVEKELKKNQKQALLTDFITIIQKPQATNEVSENYLSDEEAPVKMNQPHITHFFRDFESDDEVESDYDGIC